MPVSRKRGRENFKQLVKECTCPATVLTTERIEKFASRARAYICTYHHLAEQQKQQATAVVAVADENSSVTSAPKRPQEEVLSQPDIERVRKGFKGHRCALDFDNGFVNATLREAGAVDD